MKPQLTPSQARWLSHYDERSGDCRPSLLVERNFQAPRFGRHFGGGDSPRRRPGLSALAKEALHADANRKFQLETAVLGLVALISAWPIAIMIHEVIRLLRLIYA